MKKSVLCLLGMTILMVIVFTGCSKKSGTSSAEKPIVLKINFQTAWKGVQDVYITKALEERYYPTHPNIRVEFDYAVQNELLSTILSQHAAGGGEDAIFVIPVAAAPVLAKPGAISDLTERIKKSPMGKPGYFFDSIINNTCIYDGKFVAIPFEVDGMVLMYNSKMFNDWGVQPPKTIDEMKDIMKIAKQNGVAGYAYPKSINACVTHDLGIFYLCDGGEYVESDGAGWYKGAFEGPIAEDFIQWGREVEQYMPNDVITYDWNKMYAGFADSRFAMMFMGPWIYGQIGDGNTIPTDFPYAFTPIPKGKKESATTMGGWIYTINSDFPYQDEAFELLEFLNSPQSSAQCIAGLSAVQEAYNFAPMNKPENLPFSAALSGARGIMNDGCPLGTNVEEGFGAAYNQILYEPAASLRADAAAGNLAIQRIMDTNKPK
jgi:ABC-type glycerol-3-phosphate transport system substrate-binding protein